MSRTARTFSNSKDYHIISRGIDKQNLFYDDEDRKRFLKILKEIKEENNYIIYAYCLMSNHIHMVIKSEKEFLSKGIKSLLLRYGHYFNKKYERVGSIVQNRFSSRNIETIKYFIDVCKYVHRNPENAGICKTKDYKWSSYHEYIQKNRLNLTTTEKIIDTSRLMNHFNNDINKFVEYTTNSNLDDLNEYAEYEIFNRISDKILLEIICKKFLINNINNVASYFANMESKELKKCLEEIRKIKGINITQLSRLIRIEKGRIKRLMH